MAALQTNVKWPFTHDQTDKILLKLFSPRMHALDWVFATQERKKER